MGGKPAHTVVGFQAGQAVLDDPGTGLAAGTATVGFLSAPPGDPAAGSVSDGTASGADAIGNIDDINGAAIIPGDTAVDGAIPVASAITLSGTNVLPGSANNDGNPGAPAELSAWNASELVTEIYSGHYSQLVRLALLLVHDLQTAEEVVQDAFEAMHLAWRRLRDSEKALSYLRQTVVNRSRSVLRHRKVVDMHPPKPAPDEPSAEHAALALIERSAVTSALRLLPERQREAVVLRYYADLSEADIAQAMGISRGAVKSHTARAMAALKSILEQETP